MDTEGYNYQARKIESIHSYYYSQSGRQRYKKEFWHYTSLNTVINMFNKYIKDESADDSGEHTKYANSCEIWASNVRYMNDPEEFCSGVEFLEKKKIAQHFADRYSIVSFSSECDNLDHWKWYGKESGVAIRFNDFDAIEMTVLKEKYRKDPQYKLISMKPIPVFYSDGKKQAYYRYLVNNIIEHDEKTGIIKDETLSSLFIPFCKDIAYYGERESRMVFYDIDGKSQYVYNTGEQYRTKPALSVNMRVRDKKTSDSFLPAGKTIYKEYDSNKTNIITHIIVGPGMNQELVFNALVHIFDNEYYRYITFSKRDEKTRTAKSEKLATGKAAWIRCEDGKTRYTYRCHNGIYIMRSAVSFRG